MSWYQILILSLLASFATSPFDGAPAHYMHHIESGCPGPKLECSRYVGKDWQRHDMTIAVQDRTIDNLEAVARESTENGGAPGIVPTHAHLIILRNSDHVEWFNKPNGSILACIPRLDNGIHSLLMYSFEVTDKIWQEPSIVNIMSTLFGKACEQDKE